MPQQLLQLLPAVCSSACCCCVWLLLVVSRISYGSAACHIYNDSGSGTAVSSAAGAGAVVATRIIPPYILDVEVCSPVPFAQIFVFVFGIPPLKIRIFTFSPTPVNFQLDEEMKTGAISTFFQDHLHFVSPNPESKQE